MPTPRPGWRERHDGVLAVAQWTTAVTFVVAAFYYFPGPALFVLKVILALLGG